MNVREIVTEKIIKQLELGIIPWKRPWTGAHNAVSKKPYRGINVMLLPTEKYTCNAWLTYKQCSDLGGRIKKDEHGSMVVFYKVSNYVDEKTEEEKKSFLLRYYTVFNVEQTTLDAEKYTTKNVIENGDERADEIIGSWECPIIYSGSRACYSPSEDNIHIPPKNQFSSLHGFYGTIFHEIAHSTGHKNRLNRDLTGEFGSPSYAKEELVAEISSAMVLQSIGIEKEITNTTAYIQSWLKALHNDKNLVISASGKAEKAMQRILKIEPELVSVVVENE